jgi:hypothetical protein
VLALEQRVATEARNQPRVRIEHVHSRVKRYRLVKDRIRLWKQGVCELVMERCCALHNFRVHVTPWQPMVSRYTQSLKITQPGPAGAFEQKVTVSLWRKTVVLPRNMRGVKGLIFFHQ